MFHETNEVVGWTQGPHGSSRSVTGVVVRREMIGLTNELDEMKVVVQTIVKVTGNKEPLTSLSNSEFVKHESGEECIITQNFSPENAMGLKYSTLTTMSEGLEEYIAQKEPCIELFRS